MCVCCRSSLEANIVMTICPTSSLWMGCSSRQWSDIYAVYSQSVGRKTMHTLGHGWQRRKANLFLSMSHISLTTFVYFLCFRVRLTLINEFTHTHTHSFVFIYTCACCVYVSNIENIHLELFSLCLSVYVCAYAQNSWQEIIKLWHTHTHTQSLSVKDRNGSLFC